MTKHDERAQEPGAAEEAAEAPRWVPRTRVVSEAVVAGIPAEGEPRSGRGSGEGVADAPWRPRTRVVSEAVVAGIPEKGEAEPGGGADDQGGDGA